MAFKFSPGSCCLPYSAGPGLRGKFAQTCKGTGGLELGKSRCDLGLRKLCNKPVKTQKHRRCASPAIRASGQFFLAQLTHKQKFLIFGYRHTPCIHNSRLASKGGDRVLRQESPKSWHCENWVWYPPPTQPPTHHLDLKRTEPEVSAKSQRRPWVSWLMRYLQKSVIIAI